MTAYWLAQGVGVIAFLIGITTFFNRDERRFKLQLAVYSATIGVHFFDGRLAGGNERRAEYRPHPDLHTHPQAVGDGPVYRAHPGAGAGKAAACYGAAANYWHAGQHLGALSLLGVNCPLRHVVFDRLLGNPQRLAGFDRRHPD